MPMLAELHELWPEVGAEWIAGDGLYEDDDLSRMCMREYGIHPIFRLNDHNSGIDAPAECWHVQIARSVVGHRERVLDAERVLEGLGGLSDAAAVDQRDSGG